MGSWEQEGHKAAGPRARNKPRQGQNKRAPVGPKKQEGKTRANRQGHRQGQKNTRGKQDEHRRGQKTALGRRQAGGGGPGLRCPASSPRGIPWCGGGEERVVGAFPIHCTVSGCSFSAPSVGRSCRCLLLYLRLICVDGWLSFAFAHPGHRWQTGDAKMRTYVFFWPPPVVHPCKRLMPISPGH